MPINPTPSATTAPADSPAQPPAAPPAPAPAAWPASRWRTAALALGALAYLLLITTVVTLWVHYPSVRGPLQVVGGMLVFAGTALPAWISAIRRR
ncbi:hypothetical protein [Streptomyces violascens]|uniref:hypothetical protein n=1 Tax=Streptomyces violascens TaxID=67381 RepID=UPI00167BC530|nr:hypothetical protein [Streptomyces violascens]GGU52073.1 hypothetical protein GCM10010289_85450 [Streptomyces violascens]